MQAVMPETEGMSISAGTAAKVKTLLISGTMATTCKPATAEMSAKAGMLAKVGRLKKAGTPATEITMVKTVRALPRQGYQQKKGCQKVGNLQL